LENKIEDGFYYGIIGGKSIKFGKVENKREEKVI